MLFDVLPENFFSLLSGKNRTLYWECIYKLFSVTEKRLSFGLARDDAAEELELYFDSAFAADFQEDDDADSRSLRSSREKAFFVLRRMEDCGWILTETNNSNEKKIVFEDYAVEILRTLIRVARKEKMEYQSYIYAIYNLAKSSGANPGLALMQIYENTDRLISGLKNLNSSIKKYIDNLTRYRTVAEIMENLLVDYKMEIVDKAFHRLITADNVAKFRPEIIERLSAKKDDRKYIRKAAAEFAEINETGAEEAEEQVYDALSSIIDAFQHMDDLIDEIIRRSTKYQRAAVSRAKFMLTEKDDIRGQLREILLRISEEAVRTETDLHAAAGFEFLDELISIYRSEFLDGQSFYTPPAEKSEFEPEALPEVRTDSREKEKRFRSMAKRLSRVMSTERIERYVDEILGDREQLQASEFPHDTDEAFIRLVYIRLYGQRKNLSFGVRTQEDYFRDENAAFHNFLIYKKKR